MAKLITNHDPGHVHKILGVLVLFHYIYRLGLLFGTGNAFPQSEPPAAQALCVGIHALLSWSSLLLPLPAKRNFSSPMIWPEFRLHSIIFATRHAACACVTLLGLWPAYWLYDAAAKLVAIGMTVLAARWATDRHGCRERRTTNAMPYPPGVDERMQAGIKDSYARAQFGATVMAVFPDPTLNFMPLLAIQIAPLLMTLVRKGKASASVYHCVYTLSLFVAGLSITVRGCMATGPTGLRILVAIALSPAWLRMHRRWPLWAAWPAHVAAVWVAWVGFLEAYVPAAFAANAWVVMLAYSTVRVAQSVRVALPLWGK